MTEIDNTFEEESNHLIRQFITRERTLESASQSFFVLCPTCSFPMFSTDLANLSKITYMVEGATHSAVWTTTGGLTHGVCPSCDCKFVYQNGYITSNVQSKTSDITDTDSRSELP